MSIHNEATLRERNKWLKAMGEKEVENLEPDFDHKFYIEKVHIRGFLKRKETYGIEHPDGTGFVEGPTLYLNELLNSFYCVEGYKICVFTKTGPKPLYISNSKGEWIEVEE